MNTLTVKNDFFFPLTVCVLKEERSENGKIERIASIKVPSDIVDKGLAGCTEIIGSLSFEIPKGTGRV